MNLQIVNVSAEEGSTRRS